MTSAGEADGTRGRQPEEPPPPGSAAYCGISGRWGRGKGALTEVSLLGKVPSAWNRGELFYAESFVWDDGPGGTGVVGFVNTESLELTRISETAPDAVPEPGTLLLVGSGLIGLSRLRRRR